MIDLHLAKRLFDVGRIHLMASAIAELWRRIGRFAKRTVEPGAVLGRVRHDARLHEARARRAPGGWRQCGRPSCPTARRSPPRRRRARVPPAPDGSTVASLRISSPSTMPQCPCEVYSHRHTSVITTRSGTSRLIARIADCTGASGSAASDPVSSLLSGTPKSRTPRTPSARAAAASLTASSTESWKTPGIESTSRRTPSPSQTKSG